MKIKVNKNKCSGCRLCEIVCSAKHYRVFNPAKSFIRVDTSTEYPFPLVCPCEGKPCIENCPTNALSIGELGNIVVDENKCVRCGKCVEVCPNHIMRVEKHAVTCDLCGGEPECVKYCTLGALKVSK